MNLTTQAFAKATLVVIEQKGSDEVECRERFMAGLEVYKQLRDVSDSCHFMIVGGANNGVQPETIKSWCPEEYFGELVISNQAGNTYEKGVAIAEYVAEHKIENIIQTTSLYHSLRAYLTTLKAMQNAGLEVAFYNNVCDTESDAVTTFALLDEMLLAQGVGPELQFGWSDETYATYLAAARSMSLDAGLQKFLLKRYGESRRIAEYSEAGKGHLTTALSAEAVLATYVTE